MDIIGEKNMFTREERVVDSPVVEPAQDIVEDIANEGGDLKQEDIQDNVKEKDDKIKDDKNPNEPKVEEVKDPVDKKVDIDYEPIEVEFKSNSTTEPSDEAKDIKEETLSSVIPEDVLSYLNDNLLKGKELTKENLTSVIEEAIESSKPTLTEPVEAFKKYNEDTGRGLKDFYNLQRDWKSEPKDLVIKESLSLKYPHLSKEQIDLKLKSISVTDEDKIEYEDDPRRLAKLESEYNEFYSDALNHVIGQSEKYKAPLGGQSKEPVEQVDTEAEAKLIRKHLEAMDNTIRNDFKSFDLSLGKYGDVSIPYTDEDKEYLIAKTKGYDSMTKDWKTPAGIANSAITFNSEIGKRLIKRIINESNVALMEYLAKERTSNNLDEPIKKIENQTKDKSIVTYKSQSSAVNTMF